MALSTEELQTLNTELFGGLSPLAATYSTIESSSDDQSNKDQALADAINSLETNRTVIRSSMSGQEAFEATDPTDFTGLSDHHQLLWISFTAGASMNPQPGSKAVELVKLIFGSGSNTVSNLATARLQTVSRAAELGLPEIRAADVGESRTL